MHIRTRINLGAFAAGFHADVIQPYEMVGIQVQISGIWDAWYVLNIQHSLAA